MVNVKDGRQQGLWNVLSLLSSIQGSQVSLSEGPAVLYLCLLRNEQRQKVACELEESSVPSMLRTCRYNPSFPNRNPAPPES